ncbi:MAG: SGNH/GDSL hydrolase family protein [Acidimicrobiia bacterium]
MTTPVRVARRLAFAGALTLSAELAAAVLWPAPHQPSFDASLFLTGDGRPLRLAALGDSTLTAPGVQGPDEIWVRVVARRLSQHLARPISLRSVGVGGATSSDLVADQLDHALTFSPHLALVSVGANDVIRGVPMRRLASNLETIVSSLTESGARVLLSGVGDMGAIPRLAPPLRQMVTGLARRADRVHDEVAERHGVHKAEQWGWASEQFRTRRDVWSLDRFHPNAAGHMIWAETCWSTLEDLIEDLR